MRRALELAAQADYLTSPNPLGGAVVLDASVELAGEGFHVRAAGAQGEAVALHRADDRARAATLYVAPVPFSSADHIPPSAGAVGAFGARR